MPIRRSVSPTPQWAPSARGKPNAGRRTGCPRAGSTGTRGSGCGAGCPAHRPIPLHDNDYSKTPVRADLRAGCADRDFATELLPMHAWRPSKWKTANPCWIGICFGNHAKVGNKPGYDESKPAAQRSGREKKLTDRSEKKVQLGRPQRRDAIESVVRLAVIVTLLCDSREKRTFLRH